MKARIIVVEDERLVALAIEKSLTSSGYEVPLTISTGEEAVRKVAELEPDLVLMDIRLKGAIDGIEAAARIRNSFHIPVIYLTAYSDQPTLDRAKLTEPYGYILKPFEEKNLQAAVEMALYKSGMQAQLARTKEKLETILRCMGEGVIVSAINGTIEFLNPAAQRILLGGKPLPAEANLLLLFKILDPQTMQPMVLPLSRVILGGETIRLHNLLLSTQDAELRRVDCSIAPLRDEGSVTWGTVLVFAGMDPLPPRTPC
jgi:two-component system, cell cycle sensor histidine kinase and response regulator CckA